jgi:predicted dehydrogenase
MKSIEPIPVAVIGVGHLGAQHARLYSSLPQARLVGVADIRADRAQKVGGEHGVPAARDFRDFLPHIRAASVTVPTIGHHDIALELLRRGIDVLVEKPVAVTLAEGEEMVEEARTARRVFAVGHTERYNPAVEAMFAEAADPRFIEVHRLGVFTPRSLDIDAVLDLMIHDLDIVSALVPSEVRSIEAVGVPVLTDRVDIANARLRFHSGCVANLTASRVSQKKVRKLRVWERERYVSVDCLNQEALCYQLVRSAGGAPEIFSRPLSVYREEPLKRELEDFLEAAATRRGPRVSGEDGLRALRLATEIKKAMTEG